MPIYLAELHSENTIIQITGNDKIRAHLSNLGFVPGEKVILVNKINDNIIVKVKGVSLAISDELSKRILI